MHAKPGQFRENRFNDVAAPKARMQQSKSHLTGIISMVKASIAFSLMAFGVKLVSRTLPSLEAVFFRSLIGTIMIVIIMKAKGVSLLGRKKGLMILRGVTGFIALSLHFYTIEHLPLGTAVMLNYTAPIFAALFAVLFLNERPSLFLWAMTFMSFTGVYLLVGARLETWNYLILLGLLSAVFVGVVYISIRALRHHESPLTIIFYFTAVSTIGSIAFLPFGFRWPNLIEWLLLLAVGIGSFYGQLWMTIALRRAPASLVTPFSYLVPLLSFFYGFIFFGDRLSVTSIIGGVMIVLAGSLISYFGARKAVAEL